MHALEISDLRLITGLDQRLEGGLDQRAHPTAEDALLAEEVGLGFLGEGGLQRAGARHADAPGIRKCDLARSSGGILMHRQQARGATALHEGLAHAVPGRFGRNHAHVHLGRRLDGFEAYVEAVPEHQRLSGAEVRLDALGVDFRLSSVGRQQHNHIRPFARGSHAHYLKPVRFGFGFALAAFVQAHRDIDAVVI